jgi:hypothetical protein
MAIFDFLFGSSNPPPVETTQISTTEIPKYIAGPTADIIGEAMDVGREAWIPYTGPRLAGLTAEEQAAMAQAQAMKGISALRGTAAYDAAKAAGAPALAGVPAYMTDYQQKVADVAAQKMRDQSAIEQQNIAAKAAGAGGLDASRFAILEAERQKNLGTGIGDLYTKAQAAAYSQALKASQSDLAQGLRSGMAMGSLGTQAQMAEQADIAQQMGMGGIKRGLGQTAFDIGYTDFLSERDYPKEQLGFVSNIIRGAPFGQKTTSVGQIPQAQPRPWGQQMLGFGMQGLETAAGLGWNPMANLWGSGTSSDMRLKENIKLVGKSPSNINIYSFKYKGEDGKYEGVMAQEVPWASIVNDDGYLMVDYSKLDVEFKRLN